MLSQVARARGGVGPPPGITALDPPGASAILSDARGVPGVGQGWGWLSAGDVPGVGSDPKS